MGATPGTHSWTLNWEVSIHAPAWARHSSASGWDGATIGFNPRARVGATFFAAQLDVDALVSIHAPAWARRQLQGPGDHLLVVSIHAPAWARPDAALHKALKARFQSTRPRGRDPGIRPIIRILPTVSIHAPAWARHRAHGAAGGGLLVSIHAPAWARQSAPALQQCGSRFNPRARVGATIGRHAGLFQHAEFQSTRPRGRDLDVALAGLGDAVSIHAPAWARPQSRHGCRRPSGFQSTRPRGRDRRCWSSPSPNGGFNPRARVGATRYQRMLDDAVAVSIHAPAWARPPCVRPAGQRLCVSIHAPAWARRRRSTHASARCAPFQSTRPRGRDYGPPPGRWRSPPAAPRGFNPRARVGATPDTSERQAAHAFQSTRPRGRDTTSIATVEFLGKVSIHAPAWARRGLINRLDRVHLVSIHAPAWARHRGRGARGCRGCFNPRARVGATLVPALGQPFQRVSIHAPAWARPALLDRQDRPVAVSIHAPAWARRLEVADAVGLVVVSIHAPAWARLAVQVVVLADLVVSIHAPAWARPTGRWRPAAGPRFNPRARVGATTLF